MADGEVTQGQEGQVEAQPVPEAPPTDAGVNWEQKFKELQPVLQKSQERARQVDSIEGKLTKLEEAFRASREETAILYKAIKALTPTEDASVAEPPQVNVDPLTKFRQQEEQNRLAEAARVEVNVHLADLQEILTEVGLKVADPEVAAAMQGSQGWPDVFKRAHKLVREKQKAQVKAEARQEVMAEHGIKVETATGGTRATKSMPLSQFRALPPEERMKLNRQRREGQLLIDESR